MRKEKIILSIFAVIALVCLGIGYAALTDTLTATANVSGTGVNVSGDTNGDGTIDEEDDIVDESLFDVEWASATVEVAGGERTNSVLAATTPAISSDKNSFSFNVTNMMLKGDKVTVTAVIANNSEYDALIDVTLPASDGKVTVEATGNGQTVPAKTGEAGKLTVTITLTLNETLFSAEDNLTATYTVTFKATAQEK